MFWRNDKYRLFLRTLLLEKLLQRVLAASFQVFLSRVLSLTQDAHVTSGTNLWLVVEQMVTHCTTVWFVVS